MKKLDSLVGASYERYFENGSPNPAGDLLNAGMGLPAHHMDWWDTRKMWSYPHYSIVILLGDGTGFYRNEDGFQCQLNYGDLVITFPYQKQHYSPRKEQNWGEIYTAFNGDIFRIAEAQNSINRRRPVWKLAKPEIRVKQLQQLLQIPPPVQPEQSFQRAVSFLHLLMEMVKTAEPVEEDLVAGDWFAHACQMITADLHHKINWKDIATSLGMSYHTFRLYFRRRAGMSPLQYREGQRFKAACDLLLNMPFKTCSEIAFILGFANTYHFSEQFKKHVGVPPNEYRKRHLK